MSRCLERTIRDDQHDDLVSLDELLHGARGAQDPAPSGQNEIFLLKCPAADDGSTIRKDYKRNLNHGSRRGASRARSLQFRRCGKGD